MKIITNFLIVALLFAAANAYCQKGKISRELTPARGHYKNLFAFSPTPKSDNEEVDKQKFPFDAKSAEKRLSLKPYYLETTTLADFKIPDPPANSSEQTRAELNYLLGLQQNRNQLDVEASL